MEEKICTNCENGYPLGSTKIDDNGQETALCDIGCSKNRQELEDVKKTLDTKNFCCPEFKPKQKPKLTPPPIKL